jgi:hypothetical protein
MTARDRLDQQLDAFLQDGPTELPEASFYAVRDRTDRTGQRVVIGPWRMPNAMNKFVSLGLGAAAVVVVLVVGLQFLPSASGGVGAAPSDAPTPSPTPLGGTVEYTGEAGPATTDVDAVADGASVSGTATSTSRSGTHTVRLECADRDGDTWAFAGTVEKSTVPGEGGGDHWSAVVVRDGSPQQIGIWLSDDKTEGVDCDGWLAANDFSELGAEIFVPVESGELVPPPGLAP